MTGYALLLLDLVVVALLLTAALCLLLAVVRLPFRGGKAAVPAEATWRRCESCKRRWQAVPGDDRSAVTLRVRRAVRRRARARRRTADWARPQGWSRCPSCLSRQVRDSRQQTPR